MSFQFPLYNLNNEQFEDMVILICQKLLGIAAEKFSIGKDGGRDSRFTGKAQKYPSESDPWQGKFIIQAKFTSNPTASCSDKEFQTNVLNKEKDRIINLRTNGDLEVYLLFTNRKFSGVKGIQVEKDFKDSVSVDRLKFIGIEMLDLYLKQNKEVVKALKLDDLLQPLRFKEEDLKDIIISFYGNKEKLTSDLNEIQRIIEDSKYINMEEKNEKNILSQEYFDYMKANSISSFREIDEFLSDIKNSEYLEKYKNTVSDIQNVVFLKKNNYENFEHLLIAIENYIVLNNYDIHKSRRLIKIFLHYMYFNCDIGIK